MLKIEKNTGECVTKLRLSGRIRSDQIESIRSEMDGDCATKILDLSEVTLVDLGGVRFLISCEDQGIMGTHVPADSEHPVVGQVRPVLRFLPENLSYSLAFLQAAEAARLNRREMHEDVFAILTADETKPFSVVKPLYCSCFQLCSYF